MAYFFIGVAAGYILSILSVMIVYVLLSVGNKQKEEPSELDTPPTNGPWTYKQGQYHRNEPPS